MPRNASKIIIRFVSSCNPITISWMFPSLLWASQGCICGQLFMLQAVLALDSKLYKALCGLINLEIQENFSEKRCAVFGIKSSAPSLTCLYKTHVGFPHCFSCSVHEHSHSLYLYRFQDNRRSCCMRCFWADISTLLIIYLGRICIYHRSNFVLVEWGHCSFMDMGAPPVLQCF